MSPLVRLFVLGALTLPNAGCAWALGLPERLGLVKIEPDDDFADPGRPRASPFPGYILEAFPEARRVRVDAASPRLSLAAETVLTRDDPHLHRGPPRFSPDGRLIAYEESGTDGDQRRIVIRRLDGVEIRRVPRAREGVRVDAPRGRMGMVTPAWPPTPLAWAPSSDAFAYTRQTDLGAWEVMIADLAGEPQRIAGPPAVDGTLEWSPAGDRLAYVPATRPDEIWLADPRARTASAFHRAGAAIQSFSFSADGRRIVYSSGRPTAAIWSIAIDAGGSASDAIRLTTWAFDDRAPSFSPDGDHVAFYSSFRPLHVARPTYASESWTLLVVRADGTDAQSGVVLMDRVLLTNVSIGSTMPPAWSPDGRWVAAAQPRTQDYHAIILAEIDRNEHHEIAPESLTNEDVAVSSDGVLAYRARREWGDHVVIGLTARGARRTER